MPSGSDRGRLERAGPSDSSHEVHNGQLVVRVLSGDFAERQLIHPNSK
jgi:hypothetical protein